MKLLSYIDSAGYRRVGELVGEDSVMPLSFPSGRSVDDFQQLIESGITHQALIGQGELISISDIRVIAPIPRPRRNIFCVGKNYLKHAHEFNESGYDAGRDTVNAVPEVPIIFSKSADSVIGSGEPIRVPKELSNALDYEAELAVVIGKAGKNIHRADAINYVWGYMPLNDVTARDWQKKHKQWHLGKSFDNFCPMGRTIATADSVDPKNIAIKCWVNGDLRQSATTKDFIFDIPRIIETISAGITLYPGDIIATGTPEGVGVGFTPPAFLKSGDIVSIEIEGVGELMNEIKII